MFLINGVVQDTLAANDRAIQFGDGCFTTARIQQGQVALLDAHLQRLQTTCEKLHIPFNDWLTLSEEMQRLARPHAQGVLKVTLTRGVGGRGSADQASSGTGSLIPSPPWSAPPASLAGMAFEQGGQNLKPSQARHRSVTTAGCFLLRYSPVARRFGCQNLKLERQGNLCR